MSTIENKNYDETRIAEEIVSVLPEGVVRALSTDRRSIRFAVRAEGLKLRTIVLNRASLRRLIDDPLRAVKMEYLQRDLLASVNRAEFRYPRANRIAQHLAAKLRLPLSIKVACGV